MHGGSAPANGRELNSAISETITDLGRRFEEFRRRFKSGTRIPVELREAVAAAFQQGASKSELRRVCRISSTQFECWTSRPSRGSGPVAGTVAHVPAARVFDVVEGSSSTEDPVHIERGGGPEQPLEFRFGPWSVSVRLG